MIRRILRVLAALAIVSGSALVVLGGPVGAADAVESGWWWRANAGNNAPTPAAAPVVVPLPAEAPAPPPPPNVGEGLLVAATPDGASSIAAVRTAAGAGATLTLTVADNGDVGGAAATLLACKTSVPWTPATAGRWDDKPLPACDANTGGSSVNGIRSDDGKTWSFALGTLGGENGAVDLVIVPAANPAAPPEAPLAPFQLVFAKPGPEAFGAADSSDPSLDAGAGDFDAGEAQATADSFAADGGASTSFDSGSTSSFSTPSSSSSAFASGSSSFSPVSPALPASDQAPAVGGNQPTAAATTPVSAKDQGSARAVGMVVIAIGVAAAFAASRLPLPAPKGLARFGRAVPEPALAGLPVAATAGGKAVGGLGRFARARSGRAPSV